MANVWYIILGAILVILTKIALDDLRCRTVKHRYLISLMVLLLSSWLVEPNISILPYTLAIFIVGLLLFGFKILGAGDTKLMMVISLGVTPTLMPLMLFGVAFLGGLMALLYLIVGYLTDFSAVREKGIPYAIPISISGGVSIFLSYLGWFGLSI